MQRSVLGCGNISLDFETAGFHLPFTLLSHLSKPTMTTIRKHSLPCTLARCLSMYCCYRYPQGVSGGVYHGDHVSEIRKEAHVRIELATFIPFKLMFFIVPFQ